MSSFIFNNVFLDSYCTLSSKEESNNLNDVNFVINDYYYKCKTFEQAEIKMQKKIINNLTNNKKIDYIIGGDLVNQISITSSSLKNNNIPFIGVYSACSTFIESMILSSILLENKYANNIISITSSHNLTAERQFRYPNEYGNVRPKTSTKTATGCVGAVLSNKKSNYKITEATIGKVIDRGVTDANNMGAVMAPAAATTLYEHLKNLNKNSNDYDLIITGDLGFVGQNIFKDYYYYLSKDKISNTVDAGYLLLNKKNKNYSGCSGPCCLPLVYFCNYIKEKNYKKVLLLGTGSLHNTVLINQHNTIPSISHAICIEVI